MLNHYLQTSNPFPPSHIPDIITVMSIIDFLYSGIAVIAIIGYTPQIIKLWQSDNDSKDVSILTWLIWMGTWVISLLYGIFELEDLKFCIVAVINLFGHSAVIGLTLRNRNRFKSSAQTPES